MDLLAKPTANMEAVNTSKVSTPRAEVKPISWLSFICLKLMNIKPEIETWLWEWMEAYISW